MQSATHTIRIRAPREAVWEVLSDPLLIADWVYGVRKVEIVTDARRGLGAQWRQTNVYGPVVMVTLNEITVHDEPHALQVESVTKPRVETRHTLEDSPDSGGDAGTRVIIQMEYELPFGAAGRAAEPALGEFVGRTIVRRSAESLKRLVERLEAKKRDEPPVAP